MTIGELAARFGLATHVLRHWESMGLLSPVSRVNGRRRYSEDHVLRVGMILRGKEAGFSLEQMREVFTAADGPARRAVLRRHHAELERRIALAQSQRELVEHVLECHADDFVQCPNFKRVVYAQSQRVPVGIAGEGAGAAGRG